MPTPGPPLPALTAVFEYLGPDITPPRLVNNIQPQFPEDLRGINVTPRPFIYTIVVDQEGNVRNLKPTRVPAPTPPYDALDRCFREAILQWRYRPAEKAGRPVAVQLTVSANVEVR
ncbi:MAG: energy transducer TonB [Acidobacteriia bacterium]|nr:energy transducer TonB [Terriglobia bacterium]